MLLTLHASRTAQKIKFSIKNFFRKLQIRSHVLKKSLMKNLIFCAVTLIRVHLFGALYHQ